MTADILIIGSGLIGASFARLTAEARPEASILMVDVGPCLSQPPGLHAEKLSSTVRRAAEMESQGPSRGRPQPAGDYDQGDAAITLPGLHLINGGGLPRAAMASCVGGMGVYWSGATPRPFDTECVHFIDPREWDIAIKEAERILGSTCSIFTNSPLAESILGVLANLFDPLLPTDRHVGWRPTAARMVDGDLLITDVADILRPAPGQLQSGKLCLHPETLCRELIAKGNRIQAAVLEHRPTGRLQRVNFGAIVVAADAFRTPQLLWASGIRPPALGRHLMDHPRTNATVQLNSRLLSDCDAGSHVGPAVWSIPFADPSHPFQGQIGRFARAHTSTVGSGSSVWLSWIGRTLPRAENRVHFADARRDWCGMPAMAIEFAHSEPESNEKRQAREYVSYAAAALGRYRRGGEPRQMPDGSSFHYQGTVRMGDVNDGTSVCDPCSRVWGYDNLFLGGNGVIPTATTCNPTLMSITFAVLALPAICRVLDETH